MDSKNSNHLLSPRWWRMSRYQKLLEEEKDSEPSVPWPHEKFKDEIQKRAHGDRQNFPRPLLFQIMNSYESCYKSYQAIHLQPAVKDYYEKRLFLLQEWADVNGYISFIKSLQTVQEMIKNKSGFNFKINKAATETDIKDSQNIINILSILYESVQASENFEGMSLLLKIILFNGSQDEFIKLGKQYEILFADNKNIKALNLGAALQTHLIEAFSDFANNKKELNAVKILAELAYEEIVDMVKKLECSTIEHLFFVSSQSFSL